MSKTKRYRLSQAMYDIIQKANGGLFLLYTRHNPGDVLNLLLDGNDIGLLCRIESCNDQYYKYCKVIHADRIIDRPDFYDCTKPELRERTRQRLTQISDLGMIEVMTAQFGIPGLMSGLYIEYVWNYSDDDFNGYLDWVKGLKEGKKCD